MQHWKQIYCWKITIKFTLYFVHTVIHTYIHTLMAVAAMQGADQHIRSSLGFYDLLFKQY